MNITIDVVRESTNGAQRETWRFTSFYQTFNSDTVVVLVPDSYRFEYKQTARHKLKNDPSRQYDRLGSSRDGQNDERRCPLPDDVTDEAVAKLQSRICVRRWSDVAGKV